jgi:hypothetical protein
LTLKELQDQVKTDLKLSPDNLSIESLKTPDIHWTYNKMLMTEKLAMKKLEREWHVLYKERWEYYRKKADPEVYEKEPLLKKIIDSDAKIYLAADEKLREMQEKIDSKEELIEFLKRVMDQISQRQWIIRNAIENFKYLNGDGKSL